MTRKVLNDSKEWIEFRKVLDNARLPSFDESLAELEEICLEYASEPVVPNSPDPDPWYANQILDAIRAVRYFVETGSDPIFIAEETLRLGVLAGAWTRAGKWRRDREQRRDAGRRGGSHGKALTDEVIRAAAFKIRRSTPYERNNCASTRWLAKEIGKQHDIPADTVRGALRRLKIE